MSNAGLAQRNALRMISRDEHIRRLVASAPRLTAERRAGLAALLQPLMPTAMTA